MRNDVPHVRGLAAVVGLAVLLLPFGSPSGEGVANAGTSIKILKMVLPSPSSRVPLGDAETIEAEFALRADGTPENIAVRPGGSDFADALIQSLGAWIYVPPACEDGVAVKNRVVQRIVSESVDGREFFVAKPAVITYLSESLIVTAHLSPSLTHPLSGDNPRYLREAVAAGIARGKVFAELSVNSDGRVDDVVIRRSEPCGVFDRTTLPALRAWTFEASGMPVRGMIELNFTLRD
jgi:TonB family protein